MMNCLEILKYGTCILISFVSLFTISGAVDATGDLKDLASHKNHLGQIELINSVFWLYKGIKGIGFTY